MEITTTDWQDTVWESYEALFPLGNNRLVALHLESGEVFASHSSTPIASPSGASPSTWAPFSFDEPELARPRDARLCLILLPSVMSDRHKRSGLVERAWAMLAPGDLLVIGSANAPFFDSYRFFRRLRKMESQARAYACVGRSTSEFPPSLVSCRRDLQERFYHRDESTRTFLREVAFRCAVRAGVYAWLSDEHVLVVEKRRG